MKTLNQLGGKHGVGRVDMVENLMVAGRKSPLSLYNPHIATMEADPTRAYNV